jgi:hypothetical protein
MKTKLLAVLSALYPIGVFAAAIQADLYTSPMVRQLEREDIPKSFESSARENQDFNDPYFVTASNDSLDSMEDLAPSHAIERPIRPGKKSARRK